MSNVHDVRVASEITRIVSGQIARGFDGLLQVVLRKQDHRNCVVDAIQLLAFGPRKKIT